MDTPLSAPDKPCGHSHPSLPEPVKNYFLICFSLAGPVAASLTGFQGLVFWRPSRQVGVLKAGVQDVESKSFAPHGDAGHWRFAPSGLVQCQGWGLWCECLSLAYQL